VRLGILASGSKANAMVLEHGGAAIFIDAGLSGVRHVDRLKASGFGDVRPLALLLTHEHSDHVRNAGVISRKWKIPVYGTTGTLDSCRRILGDVPGEVILENGSTMEIGPFTVTSFSVAHDAADPSGYVVEWQSGKLGIATDLGSSSPLVEDSLSGCGAVVLEFNHDEDMLWNGDYPWYLKQRIASNKGHLSNDAASRLLGKIVHRGLKVCILAHLSRENNRPHLAEKVSRAAAGARADILMGLQDDSLPALEL